MQLHYFWGLAAIWGEWQNAAMVSKRSIREEGHRRKFLAVIDDTPECATAVTYASRRARTTNGVVVLLYIVKSEDFQQWMGVGDIMRAEARAEAQTALERHADKVRRDINMDCELVIREGAVLENIRSLIEDDSDIAILILAAGNGKDGPGPLVQSIAASSGSFAIPVTVVPFGLSDEEIELLT